MKKLVFTAFAAFLAWGAYAQNLQFETTEISYGEIEKGADGVRVFKFTNSGSAPLIITNAQQSCGCTVPAWPKEPIMPGESASIQVKYDTQRVGHFAKHVTVTSNAIDHSTVQLKISGHVLPESAATPQKEKGIF